MRRRPLPSRRATIALALAILCAALNATGCGDDGGKAPPGTPATPKAGDAPYASDGTPMSPLPRAPKKRSVLLICLDTLRSDSLAPWPRSRDLMPGLYAWLKKAVVFREAESAAPWTGPSTASLLTGLLPSHHGAREFSDTFQVIDAVPTLAEILSVQEWRTAAYTGGGWVSKDNGMLQGFERAKDTFSFGGGAELFRQLNQGLRQIAPWFLFLHTYEAHDPYGAPPPKPNGARWPPRAVDVVALEKAAELDGGRELARLFLTDPAARQPLFDSANSERRSLFVRRYFEAGFAKDPQGPALAAFARERYEAGVRALDVALSTYLAGIEADHVIDDTIVVVTSDHGEAFGEHGRIHHGRHLTGELLRVPLAIRAPGWPEGLVIDEPVSVLDVFPTVLDLLGMPVPPNLDGRSLVPVVGGAAGHPCVSEESRTESQTGFPGAVDLVAVRDKKWRWVRSRDRATGVATEETFDLDLDPGERSPTKDADPAGYSAEFRAAVERARNGR